MLKGILFDLDGTLVNTIPLIEECYRYTFIEKLGVAVSIPEIMTELGRPLKDICQKLVPDQVDEACQIYYDIYNRLHNKLIKEYPGVKDVLFQLKNLGYRLAIVTSKNKVNTVKALNYFGLEGLWNTIVSSDDCQHHKPHPEPVLKALQLMEIKPIEALFIGDSPYDILAGKAAGVKTAGITWGTTSKEDLLAMQPDFMLENLNDLLVLQIINNLKFLREGLLCQKAKPNSGESFPQC